jgi:hypothetical protein
MGESAVERIGKREGLLQSMSKLWRVLLLSVFLLMSMPVTGIAAAAEMFGITAAGQIDRYDPVANTYENLYQVTDVKNLGHPSGPNGLAYDTFTNRIYYTEYPDLAPYDGMADVWFVDLDDLVLSESFAGKLPGQIACADFYLGEYFYIDGGTNPAIYTDDLYKVSFNANGTIASWVKWDISGNAHKWGFWGDVAIWDGVLYGWGNCFQHGTHEFFRVKTDGTDFHVIQSGLSQSLQLAFDTDGTLYGHEFTTGNVYKLEWTDDSLTRTFMHVAPRRYTDLASGETSSETYEICGYKYIADTYAVVEGWTIYLEKDEAGSWVPVASTTTGPDGKYCFSGLPAGTYRVTEAEVPGFSQVYPADGHVVTLPLEKNVLYGVEQTSADLYEIDVPSGIETKITGTGSTTANINSPNGLAYDSVNRRLYFGDYGPENAATTPLYFYDVAAATVVSAGTVEGITAGAAFGKGAYWYIKNGTDDLYNITFNADGTVATNQLLKADVTGSSSFFRFGDLAVSPDGNTLYGASLASLEARNAFFSIDISDPTYPYTEIKYPATVAGLQLAFASDGELYGHSTGTKVWYHVDTTDGTYTSLGALSRPYTDLASGQSVYNFINAVDEVTAYTLSGSKWYDRDKDGVWDEGEPGLEGWKIYLYEWQVVDVVEDVEVFGWVEVATTLTAPGGSYSFDELEPGTYRVVEGVDADASGWVQTFPVDPNYYEVDIVDADVPDLDFGNVCEATAEGGYTLGWWGNKNGMKALGDDWAAFLNEMGLVDKIGEEVTFEEYSAFRTWLLKANSVNMSYMLSVQMAVTNLNMEYMGTDYTGAGILGWDDEWISIDELLIEAGLFLADHPETFEGDPFRAQAEFYKNVFDGLNNNKYMLIPYEPCPVPTNWL